MKTILSIGITTKGRIADLCQTLKKLEQHDELSACPILLINDGGGEDFVKKSDFKLNIAIYSYKESAGLVARRNELADLCETPYLLSLDDDSSPVGGSFEDVLGIFEDDLSVATVALRLIGNGEEHVASSESYESRYFVGCGHVHKVSTFKLLGGYIGELFYGHEEIAYAYEVYKAKYKIVHTDSVVVHHRKSDVLRINGYNGRMHYNRGLINTGYLPTGGRVIELASFLKSRLKSRSDIVRSVKDYIRGVRDTQFENRMDFATYLKWKQLKTPSIR